MVNLVKTHMAEMLTQEAWAQMAVVDIANQGTAEWHIRHYQLWHLLHMKAKIEPMQIQADWAGEKMKNRSDAVEYVMTRRSEGDLNMTTRVDIRPGTSEEGVPRDWDPKGLYLVWSAA